jgi:CHASE3 domain sensor protein
MNNMRLSEKLIGAFIIVSVITVIVGGIGIYSTRAIAKANQRMYESD